MDKLKHCVSLAESCCNKIRRRHVVKDEVEECINVLGSESVLLEPTLELCKGCISGNDAFCKGLEVACGLLRMYGASSSMSFPRDTLRILTAICSSGSREEVLKKLDVEDKVGEVLGALIEGLRGSLCTQDTLIRLIHGYLRSLDVNRLLCGIHIMATGTDLINEGINIVRVAFQALKLLSISETGERVRPEDIERLARDLRDSVAKLRGNVKVLADSNCIDRNAVNYLDHLENQLKDCIDDPGTCKEHLGGFAETAINIINSIIDALGSSRTRA